MYFTAYPLKIAQIVLLIGLYAFNTWVDLITIFKEIIFKIIYIVGLIHALTSIYEVQKIKNENDYFRELKW